MRHRFSNPVRATLVLLVGMVLCAGCAGKKGSEPAKASPREPAAAPPPLIPRKLIFGNPDRAGVQISPDGKHVSFVAPRDGVMNVYVAPASDPSKATPITNDRTRGITNYFWA